MFKQVALILGLCVARPLLGQTAPATAQSPGSGPAWSPAKSLGIFAYPKNNQSADQQLKDESECYGSARQQSGVDPTAPPLATKTEEQKKAEQKAAADNAKQAKGGRVKGAAGGAAAGAAIGAVAGDAGTGAGAGAVGGTMVGGAKQRQANKAAKQQAAQATAQKQQQEEAQSKAQHQQPSTRSSGHSLLAWMRGLTPPSDLI